MLSEFSDAGSVQISSEMCLGYSCSDLNQMFVYSSKQHDGKALQLQHKNFNEKISIFTKGPFEKNNSNGLFTLIWLKSSKTTNPPAEFH